MIHPQRHIARLARSGADLTVGLRAGLRALWAGGRITAFLQPGRSAGRVSGRPARRPESMAVAIRGLGRALALVTLLVNCFSGGAALAASYGVQIPNTATLNFVFGGEPMSKDSNTVVLMVRSPAVIEFLKYAPNPASNGELVHVPPVDYDQGSGTFVAIPPPAPTLNDSVPLVGMGGNLPVNYFLGEMAYLRVTDLDQNVDPQVTETILVTVTCAETGDEEVLRLTETGPDTGIFAGYLPTTADPAYVGPNGVLVVMDECNLEASYTDPFDLVKTVTDAALIDPWGIVFNSLTGDPVEGAQVTLQVRQNGVWVDATVFADDGVTETVSTVVTDADGKFRFPYVTPGEYRLVVIPPEGYTAPTAITDDARLLQARPGAVIVLGSRGEPFPIDPGPALRIDFPVDPLRNYLWLEKSASEEEASVGDFLKYTLTLENHSGNIVAPAVRIDDRLPLGFRYQDGSTRVNGVKAADPSISADGRVLTFQLSDLPPNSTIEVTYVVEVAAGAKSGKAVNTAQARDSHDTVSNRARFTVEVREAFFRDKAILLGRVLTGNCSEEDTAMQGLPGVRIYLEDGSFVVTDKDGKYHFEGIEPGTHVVQVDLLTLPAGYQMIPCEETTQFAGRTFAQFVDLQGGTLWRANFYAAPLPPPTGEVTLRLFSTLAGEVATLRAEVKASAVPVDNLRVTVMLPGAATYLAGTARQDGREIAEPSVMSGAVTLRAPRQDAGQTTVFTFQARLPGSGQDGELPAKALLTFDSPAAKNQRTPLAENRFRLTAGPSRPGEEIRLYPRFPVLGAELQPSDREMLEQLAARLKQQQIERIEVVGHTDSQRIAPQNRHLFADNQALSEARARSIADFLRQRLGLPAGSITQRGMGETLPIADNATAEGRALNRRVELNLVTAATTAPARLEVTKGESEPQRAATVGASPAEARPAPRKVTPPPAAQAPELSADWLAALKPETRIVWPEPGYAPELHSTAILVQHPRGARVEVRVNGVPVDPLRFNGIKPVADTGYIISDWQAVDLVDGLNRIEATVGGHNGQPATVLQREIWYVTLAEKIEWLKDKSTLLADGLHPPTFALRLTDLAGHPLRPGQQLDFRVSRPYEALRDSATEDLVRTASDGKLTVGADGVAYAQLEPTAQAGNVTVSLLLPGEPLEVHAWLKPVPREWIMVGFAEGTVGHNTIHDNAVSAEEAGIDDGDYSDGRVKFFAKGAIKGEWLLTLAYDSDKPDLDGDSLQQVIDPDTYYPLYGDETQQGYEAASARKLYVKLERDQFYALFGDMETGMTRTVLSQYSRSLNGFKSELQGELFSFVVFAADTKQAFVKDELRGDGTSGRYTLSQKDLVINSEEVVIEIRDRFHNERIVTSEPLARHIDYDIDYDAGTIYFKRPIPSKDRDFNPIFIVVRYETQSSSSANLNYGGRAAVKLLDQRVEAGASLVHEENGAAEGNLYGADVTVQLTPTTTVRAEVATTDVDELDDDRKGDAYLAEIEHRGESVDGRAWFRQQDGTFGLGQQNGGTNGMRTYGAQGAWRFNPEWSLAGELWHEDNLDTDAQRDVGSVQALYRTGRFGLSAGVREARDTFEDGEKQTSRQLLLGGDWSTPDRALTLRATHEQSLGGSNENSDFPTRTMIGADYRLTQNVSLFAEQEFTWGEEADTQGTRVGLKSTPWEGGTISTAVERQLGENGERLFALFGLGQSWQINPNWSVDLAVDRSQTFRNEPAGERVNPDVPPASGHDEPNNAYSGNDDDFTAVSLGAAYKVEKWSWWNRVETRQGESEDKYGFSSGLIGEVSEGTAVSARLMVYFTDTDDSQSDEEEITLGLAYRPDRSQWIILERLDLSLNNEESGDSDDESARIVNHLHANHRSADRKWQTSFYYGLKYVRTDFDGDSYDGFTDMLAAETRYNLNPRWDVGANAAVLHSWNSEQIDYSAGASVGFLVMTNTWISAGYNVRGFDDDDFSAANYTAEGPFIRFRMKFDQQSAREAAEWLNRKE